jgi:hypothetical protein
MELLFVFFVGLIFFVAISAGNKKPVTKKADNQGFINDFDNWTHDEGQRNVEPFEVFHDDSSTDFNDNNDSMDWSDHSDIPDFSDTSSNENSSGGIPSDF